MHHRNSLLFCLALGFALSAHAQFHSVSGRVIDGKTKEPLPFVNIVINGSNQGGTSDIDGKFSLRSGQPVRFLRLSCVGYEPLRHETGQQTKNLLLVMNRKEIDLQEVEILPGVNPAHRIIRNVIDNRDRNDPEKVSSFSYTAYDKTVFTVDADTTVKEDFAALVDTSVFRSPSGIGLQVTMDSDSAAGDSVKADSANRLIEKLINNQYLFLMENVTKRKFMAPDKNYNKVVATKMSGFKDPILVFLTTQIQSFSFYKPFISIMMKDYVNPIGSGGLSKYFFKIADTTYSGNDTVFIITFRPMKGTNFDGLKGVLAVNSFHWAIQNVSAEPAGSDGGMVIRIHQMYELVDSTQWFPVQLNTDVAFNNMRIGKYKAVGRGRSYIRDIQLNPDLVRREFSHLDVEVDKAATTRDESYWDQFRVDSLSRKDRQTYHVLDSVGKAENFDRMAKTLQTVLTGRIPWGPIDFDLDRIVKYNTYEGLVLGAGIHTNDRLSQWFRIGGFYQYAFAVQTSKYGGDVRFLVDRRHDITLGGDAFFDLTESGGVQFPGDQESILSGNFRELMLKKLDRTRHFGFSAGLRAFKYFLFHVRIAQDRKRSTTFDLVTDLGNAAVLDDRFTFTTLGAGFKWAYGEKFIRTVNNKISLGTRYPVVWFEYSRGITGLFDGEYAFNRFDLKIRKTFHLKYLGKLTVQVNGGYVDEPIPACNLYYAPASYRTVTLYAPNSFATMRSNEFLSSRYASVFLYHDFGYLLYKGKGWFHPEFALAQNAGFGWLDHPERYRYLTLAPRTLDLGYYESGLLVNNLLNVRLYTVGLGVFYRWGPYSMDRAADNLAGKLTVFFKL